MKIIIRHFMNFSQFQKTLKGQNLCSNIFLVNNNLVLLLCQWRHFKQSISYPSRLHFWNSVLTKKINLKAFYFVFSNEIANKSMTWNKRVSDFIVNTNYILFQPKWNLSASIASHAMNGNTLTGISCRSSLFIWVN